MRSPESGSEQFVGGLTPPTVIKLLFDKSGSRFAALMSYSRVASGCRWLVAVSVEESKFGVGRLDEAVGETVGEGVVDRCAAPINAGGKVDEPADSRPSGLSILWRARP
jgi:hypothetical protein